MWHAAGPPGSLSQLLAWLALRQPLRSSTAAHPRHDTTTYLEAVCSADGQYGVDQANRLRVHTAMAGVQQPHVQEGRSALAVGAQHLAGTETATQSACGGV
jgi:uncharacterized protein YbaP (TraB family)